MKKGLVWGFFKPEVKKKKGGKFCGNSKAKPMGLAHPVRLFSGSYSVFNTSLE